MPPSPQRPALVIGLTGGIGFFWWLSNAMAIDLGVIATYGEYVTVSAAGESVDLDPGLKATSSRIDIGLMFFPGG